MNIQYQYTKDPTLACRLRIAEASATDNRLIGYEQRHDTCSANKHHPYHEQGPAPSDTTGERGGDGGRDASQDANKRPRSDVPNEPQVAQQLLSVR